MQWINGNSWVQGIEYKIGMLVTNQGNKLCCESEYSSTKAYTEPRYLPIMDITMVYVLVDTEYIIFEWYDCNI